LSDIVNLTHNLFCDINTSDFHTPAVTRLLVVVCNITRRHSRWEYVRHIFPVAEDKKCSTLILGCHAILGIWPTFVPPFVAIAELVVRVADSES